MNTTRATKRILSFALAITLVLGMAVLGVPETFTTYAADVEMQAGLPNITVNDDRTNTTQIAFAGTTWYVIGYDGTGVASSGGTMTLLSVNNSGIDVFNQNTSDGNEYANSWLRGSMNRRFYSDTPGEYISLFDPRERAIVETHAMDGVAGSTESDPLWALSVGEANDLKNDLRELGGLWWLRSPGNNDYFAAFVTSAGSVDADGFSVLNLFAIRPAFRLDLSSVIFTSDASGASSKSNATVGSTLESALAPTGEIKLTVSDSGLAVNITNAAESSSAVTFDYDVTNGSPNSLSAIVREISNGDITHYGRLADNPASGNATVTLPSGFDPATHTLEVFVEEINSDYETDYASQPFAVTWTDAAVTVADVDFGSVTLGYSQPAARDITITNNGGTGATITNISLTGTNAIDFILDDTAPSDTTVPAGGTNTSWTVQPEDGLPVGDYEAEITVTYDSGQTATGRVTFKVEDNTTTPPDPGTLTLGAMTDDRVEEGEDYHKTIPATYVGDATVSPGYSASGLPSGLNVNGSTGVISGQPDVGTAGDYTVNVTVTAGSLGESGSYTLTVTDTAVNTYLELASISDDRINLGDSYTKTLSVAYNGTGALAYTITGLPNGVNHNGGVISGAPTQAGIFDIDISVSDNDLTATGGYTLEVVDSGDPGTRHMLTVVNGSGGGRYEAGESVTISADPATAGQVFDGWSGGNGGSFADAGSATTTFTMPDSNATVTATYRDNSGTTTGGSTRSSGGSSGGSTYTAPPKTQLPASAFSWDGDRTLTIDHERITPLGLLRVDWDGAALTRGTDYAVYQGSVIVRFDADFIATQAPGNHTVRVEFLNHYGETTITLGAAGAATDAADNNTYNPNTGGWPEDYVGTTNNPNTGDSRSIWPALLLGSLSAAALVVYGGKLKRI